MSRRKTRTPTRRAATTEPETIDPATAVFVTHPLTFHPPMEESRRIPDGRTPYWYVNLLWHPSSNTYSVDICWVTGNRWPVNWAELPLPSLLQAFKDLRLLYRNAGRFFGVIRNAQHIRLFREAPTQPEPDEELGESLREGLCMVEQFRVNGLRQLNIAKHRDVLEQWQNIFPRNPTFALEGIAPIQLRQGTIHEQQETAALEAEALAVAATWIDIDSLPRALMHQMPNR
ncbi:uncharacterized protein BP01DRAFT_399893 [Aspergillus saccharolyticus JOP 1030-1]|uniref:Uncharacterized protein n=1 Tax=Aspergillus saccharolyticus JOP 1030-1 TaxID=1450539 RepID=A0A318ZDR4_9EURO|nr:hypothetical protein BP01DRAFT_399893 [Aspergillus saccharolyticus JOP 1030-1]PYH44727.1 hypothetical protein BP01DRAFT_399893 [Aspergillus saccharolyticus JOP 1030-1]